MQKQKVLFFLILWIFSIFLFSAVILIFYSNYKDSQIQLLKHEESFHVNEMTEFGRNAIKELFSDILVQSSHAHLLEIMNNHDKKALESLNREYESFINFKIQYDQIRLINNEGQEISRVNSVNGESLIVPEDKLQNKAHRYYVKEILALSPGEIYMSPFDLNIENNEIEMPYKPMIRVGTPVVDERDVTKGFIILNYSGTGLLELIRPNLNNLISLPMMVNNDGYWLKSSIEEEQWGFMFEEKKDNKFQNTYPGEWKKIINTKSGQFTSDKGLFTYNTIIPSEVANEAGFSIIHEGEVNTDRLWKVISYIPEIDITKIFSKIRRIVIMINLTTVFLLTVIFYLSALYSEKKRIAESEKEILIIELQEALNNVKTLSGLMPICAKCKKIRDDKGYWNQIEKYIEKHSGAVFSHGLCPVCMEELYKDKPWFEKWKKANNS